MINNDSTQPHAQPLQSPIAASLPVDDRKYVHSLGK